MPTKCTHHLVLHYIEYGFLSYQFLRPTSVAANTISLTGFMTVSSSRRIRKRHDIVRRKLLASRVREPLFEKLESTSGSSQSIDITEILDTVVSGIPLRAPTNYGLSGTLELSEAGSDSFIPNRRYHTLSETIYYLRGRLKDILSAHLPRSVNQIHGLEQRTTEATANENAGCLPRSANITKFIINCLVPRASDTAVGTVGPPRRTMSRQYAHSNSYHYLNESYSTEGTPTCIGFSEATLKIDMTIEPARPNHKTVAYWSQTLRAFNLQKRNLDWALISIRVQLLNITSKRALLSDRKPHNKNAPVYSSAVVNGIENIAMSAARRS
ncbi:uncharacterized protein CLUP02_11932 [Colletotrichum lupini]|uniref:Uncharacterized protein n=1 Tax=Colletotrichum lupini TaxID=145971 RepID=A0A9Q8SZI8_9PEZI|nr:uncharacterized protein CLUP02_11932 [Colletotrichum lupini]UQC86431.1 hypothetical protein CLUP02_11932 [Colletotrichum lupini]